MTAVPVVLVLFEVVSGDSCRSLVVVGGRRARWSWCWCCCSAAILGSRGATCFAPTGARLVH